MVKPRADLSNVNPRDDDLHPGLDLVAERDVDEVVASEPDAGLAEQGRHRLGSGHHRRALLVVQNRDLVWQLDADSCTGEGQPLRP